MRIFVTSLALGCLGIASLAAPASAQGVGVTIDTGNGAYVRHHDRDYYRDDGDRYYRHHWRHHWREERAMRDCRTKITRIWRHHRMITREVRVCGG